MSTSLEGIFAWCKYFDWFYQNTDDNRVYLQGVSAHNSLMKAIGDNPTYKAIYEAWKRYYHSGPTFGTERAPEPHMEDFDVPSV